MTYGWKSGDAWFSSGTACSGCHWDTGVSSTIPSKRHRSENPSGSFELCIFSPLAYLQYGDILPKECV